MTGNLKEQLEKARQAMMGGKRIKSETLKNISDIPSKNPPKDNDPQQSQIAKARLSMARKTDNESQKKENLESISQEERDRAIKSMASLEQKRKQEIKKHREEEEKKMKTKMAEIEKNKETRGQKEEEIVRKKRQKEKEERERERELRAQEKEKSISEKDQLAKEKSINLPKTQTMRNDFLKATHSEQASLASLSTKSTPEEKKHWREIQSSTRGKKQSILFFFLIILLLLGSTSLIYYSFQAWRRAEKTTMEPLKPSILAGDNYIDLDIYKKTSREIIISLRRVLQTEKLIGQTTIIKLINKKNNPETGRSYEYPIGINEINLLDINLPKDFTNFLKNDFVLGSYSAEKSNEIFYLFQSRSFPNTFNQLINNGNNISRELLSPFITIEQQTALETGSFKNDYLANINVRVLSVNERSYIVYGWLDQETILITQSKDAFAQILQNWRASD